MAKEKVSDKFIWKQGDIVETSQNVAEVKVTPLFMACSDLGIRQRDYLILKSKLSDRDRRILEVINPETTTQWVLYIREMVKYLEKANKLPTQYRGLLVK